MSTLSFYMEGGELTEASYEKNLGVSMDISWYEIL